MLKMSKLPMLLAVTVLLVIGVVLAGGCTSKIIENIAPEEAFILIQENQDNPDFFIIDVRTPQEFAGGHIENALILDYYSDTFRDDLDKLDKDKTYLIYCRVGGRSGEALAIMEELGFLEAYNLSGGINAWQEAGLPIVTE